MDHPLVRNSPLVSVIIPCYNQAEYLLESIESVSNQSYSNIECIVVNDGSTDCTSKTVHELIKKYSDLKIILIEKQNAGLSEARNSGITIAAGKYILPLDADDKIHPDMIKKLLNVLEANPRYSIAYCDYQFFGNSNKIINTLPFNKNYLTIRNIFSYCSLYRLDVWKTVGGYNSNMKWGYEDWDFWISCIEKGFVAKRVTKILFYYRSKESSMYIEAFNNHDLELKKQIVKNHLDFYKDKIKFIENNFKIIDFDLKIKILFSQILTKIILSKKIKTGIDFFYIGKATYECGLYKNSFNWFNKSLCHKKLTSYMKYEIASLYKKQNNFENAENIFKNLTHSRIKIIQSGSFFHLGEIYLNKNNSKSALFYFNECIKINPNHAKCKYYLENANLSKRSIENLEKFKKNCVKIIQNPKNFYDVNFIITVRGRTELALPMYRSFLKAKKKSSLKIIYTVVEHSVSSDYANFCKKYKLNYIWLPCSSTDLFNKCAAYNIGAILSNNSKFIIFHDLDCLIQSDFFNKLFKNIKFYNCNAIQCFQKRRALHCSPELTKKIINGKINVDKLCLQNPEIDLPRWDGKIMLGAPGGSIMIAKQLFFDVGGYDDDIFLANSPEDAFFWEKVDAIDKMYTSETPPIDIFHMYHPPTYKDNPFNHFMSNIFSEFKKMTKKEKIEIIKKRSEQFKKIKL